nr:BlaI/MecI/CopY family transcriptional regulator [Desulfosporosinus sp. OT]
MRYTQTLNIIWEHSPVSSTELVMLANEELGWKKSTTYTVIRSCVNVGAIKNENTVVYALINLKEKLSKDEVEELKKIVEQYGKEE